MADTHTPSPGSHEPSPFDRLAARLQISPSWMGRISNLALLLAVSVVCAFVISPSLSSQQIPELGEADVGKPFRAASAAGFKAGRDHEIVDGTLTGQRREEARAAVRPVYDYRPAVLSELRRAVRDAFDPMQEIVASAPPPVEPSPKKRRSPEPAVPAEPSLADQLRDQRRSFEQGLFGADQGLEDEDFAALQAARFSEDVERATLTLLERAYLLPVATSREELARVGGRGLTVRQVIDAVETQRSADAESVKDVREAQGELERFASVPGNLLPDAPGSLRRAVLRLAKRLVRPNLTINTAETDARGNQAAQAVKPAIIQIKKGQKVIGDGELINPGHLVVLRGMREQTDQLDTVSVQVGSTGLIAVTIAALYTFLRAASRRFRPTRKDAVLLGALLVTLLGIAQIGVAIADALHDRYPHLPSEAMYFAIPAAAGAMLVRFILSDELAIFFAVVFAALAGMMLGHSLSYGVYVLVGSLVAANLITRAKDRLGIFKAGVITGAVNVLVVLFLALAERKGLSSDTLVAAGFAFAGTTLGVPVLVMGLTPLIEFSFGYASDIKLLELANLNHPALKELIVQAPGTYHHSIIIGSLVENAAEAIGANPLLARSCAYYHDIGKGKNPLYFGENQKGENRHDTLAPAMSAVIIKRHVTDGLEMARQYRLPKLVADAIPQHHGTRLVGYFFHKALNEQEGKENPQPVDEAIYRYAGPKPQFREAALVMIADAVESSCRSIAEPTSQKLQAQVQKIINVIFSEGQLDECEITLKDLNLIAQSFLHTLEGIYHTRPAYPAGAVGGRQGVEPAVKMVGAATSPPRADHKRTGTP